MALTLGHMLRALTTEGATNGRTNNASAVGCVCVCGDDERVKRTRLIERPSHRRQTLAGPNHKRSERRSSMAADSLPLNPELTFQHISVHCLNILAQYIAREKVKAQLRADGALRYARPREINEKAAAYLHDHPECWREALTQAHQIDSVGH